MGKGVRTTTVDDVGFIEAMLEWSKQRFPAAFARVFVAGASNGGMMTYRLLIETSLRFTAAAAFVACSRSTVYRCRHLRARCR